MYVDMIANQKKMNCDLSSLYSGIIGAAPSPPELIKSIEKDLSVKRVMCGYGMTETSPLLSVTCLDDDVELKANTVGYCAENIELQVVNPETNKIVRIGEQGELWARGYNVMLGYWNNKEKTDEAITKNGWMRTGYKNTLLNL